MSSAEAWARSRKPKGNRAAYVLPAVPPSCAAQAARAQPAGLVELINQLETAPEHELGDALRRHPRWTWPRTDLQCWIQVLNRFDEILERLSSDYALPNVQSNPFTPKTKDLVLAILRFSQLLFENATNRKIYASYDVRPRRLADHERAIERQYTAAQ
jgi:hypothetical protein